MPNTKAPPDIYGQKALPPLKDEFQSLTQEHCASHGTPHNTPELPGKSSSLLQGAHREVTPRPQTYINKPLCTSPSPWGPILLWGFPEHWMFFPVSACRGKSFVVFSYSRMKSEEQKLLVFSASSLSPSKVSMKKHRLLFLPIHLPINTQIIPETRSLPPLKPSRETAHTYLHTISALKHGTSYRAFEGTTTFRRRRLKWLGKLMEHNSHGDFLSTSQQTQNELTHLSTEPQHQNTIPRNVCMLYVANAIRSACTRRQCSNDTMTRSVNFTAPAQTFFPSSRHKHAKWDPNSTTSQPWHHAVADPTIWLERFFSPSATYHLTLHKRRLMTIISTNYKRHLPAVTELKPAR